ncbi:putative RNA-directed DNA polymerase from mobile element jockey-like, partial [Apostichopus japonicus]
DFYEFSFQIRDIQPGDAGTYHVSLLGTDYYDGTVGPILIQHTYRIFGYRIQRLQRLQNSAARLVVDCYDFNTPSLNILHSLHWLPVEFRIKFKVLLLVYKCIHGMAPAYLSDDLSFQVNTRYTLRSSNTLTVPRTKLKTYGDRAFPSAGPKLWNGLPISVRSSPTLSQFKSCLKTIFSSRVLLGLYSAIEYFVDFSAL